MICNNCGREIGEDVFCKYCGIKTNFKETTKRNVDAFSEGYLEANYDLLNTFASENGQKGCKIFVDGNIKDVAGEGSMKYLIISTMNDKDWMIIPSNKNTNFSGLKSYISKHVRVNCIYEGKSSKLQLPVAIFQDIYDYNSQTSTKDDDSNIKANTTIKKEISRENNSDEEDITKFKEAWGNALTAFGSVGKYYVKAVKELYGFNETNDEKQVVKQETVKEYENEAEKLHKTLKSLKDMYDSGLLNLDEYNEKRDLILNNGKKEIKKTNHKKIRKCPHCGEILEAYTLECPTCGNKISNGFVSSAMEEFKDGLNRIDDEYAQTMLNVTKQDNSLGMYEAKNSFNDKKADYIRNFTIPVSVNDMLDFMILAKSNVETKLYKKKVGLFNLCGYGNVYDVHNAKKMSDAWFSMMQQIYDKAQISLKKSEAFNTIKQMYDEIKKEIVVF